MLADAASSTGIVTNGVLAMAGLFAIAGGVIGAINYRGKAAVRQARLDEAADCVLEPGGLRDQLAVVKSDVAEIRANTKKNGGHSDSVGDTVSRIETQLAELLRRKESS